jgi:hypothetical protein
MTALSARFREIEVTLGEPAGLPRDLPATWLNPEQSGVVVGFTDSRYESERNRADIQRLFPQVRAVSERVMPLRAIMLAVSKSAQSAKGAR